MPDERMLVQEAITGNASAFEELTAPYIPQLRNWLGYMLDEEAEDCLQEVFMLAWLKLSSLNDPGRFRGWLFRLARNKSMDYLRRRKRKNQREIPIDLLEGYLSHQPDFRNAHALEEWISALPEAERAAIWLYYMEDLSIKTIARHQNITVGRRPTHQIPDSPFDR